VVSALPTGGFLVLWMSGASQDGDAKSQAVTAIRRV